MNTKLIAGFLLAGSCLFAGPRIAVGIGVGLGGPVAPIYVAPAYVAPAYAAPAYVPPAPGPGFTWVAGYWVPGHIWRPGYWAGPRAGFFGPRGRFRR